MANYNSFVSYDGSSLFCFDHSNITPMRVLEIQPNPKHLSYEISWSYENYSNYSGNTKREVHTRFFDRVHTSIQPVRHVRESEETFHITHSGIIAM